MYTEYDDNNTLPPKADFQSSEQPLPSRKNKHPKPTSFLEKPTFSLIIFILFILVLGGIFLFYFYEKDSDSKENNTLNAEQSNKKVTNEDNEDKNANENVNKEDTSKQEAVPVVDIIVPSTQEEQVDTPAETVPVKEEVQPKEVIHIVKDGETLYSIAKKYYIKPDFERIKEANGLKNDNIIAGMKLIIPDPVKTP